MVALFKKQKQSKEELDKIVNQAELESKQIQERIKKEVVVHSMPQKVNKEKKKVSKTKKIGILIILGGIVLLITAIIILYYFLFANNNTSEDISKQINNVNNKEQKSDNEEVKSEIVANETSGSESKVNDDSNDSQADNVEESEVNAMVEESATSSQEATQDDGAGGDNEEQEADVEPANSEVDDIDGDSLSNEEEVLLSTDMSNRDTDNDGYDDLSELLNLYNPNGTGDLLENENIDVYEVSGVYKVFYPTRWEKISEDERGTVIFSSPDEHYLKVIVNTNDQFKSVETWYRELFPEESDIFDDRKISNENFNGIKSSEGYNLYLVDKNRNYFFVLSYEPAADNQAFYSNIYEMFIKSFDLD